VKVGFTGTRLGMTSEQARRIEELLIELRATELHHGDCRGADAQAHDIAWRLGLNVVIHPPVNPRMRAFCPGPCRPAKDYLERDHDIVDECEVLLATPRGPEELRSGTWATVRYARKIGRRFLVVF